MFPLDGDGGKVLKTHSVLDKSLAGLTPRRVLGFTWLVLWGAGG